MRELHGRRGTEAKLKTLFSNRLNDIGALY